MRARHEDMPLTLNDRAWVLAERLYLHARGVEPFKELLREFDLDYPGEPYEDFDTNRGRYTFMSEPNYAFAEFMKLVPAYKYLPILKRIIFDPRVRKTQRDGWNYYGENINSWRPDLVDLLGLVGVEVDEGKKELLYEEELEEEAGDDFLPYAFGDPYLDYLRKEANEAHRRELYLSVMFLVRKMLETVLVSIFEVVFPKLVNKEYSEDNHGLWFDKRRNRHRAFDVLLDNLKEHASNFHEDEELVLELVALVRPFKNETNRYVHRDYKLPDRSYVAQWKIPQTVNMVRKMYRKYCNP